jgi:hypothetical protein
MNRVTVALTTAAIMTWAASATAASPLQAEMAAFAKDLKSFLDGKGHQSIALGQFTGPPNYPTAAGPGIVQCLSEELVRLGVTVKARAPVGLKGQYKVAEVPDEKDPKSKLLAIEITATLEDAFGKVLTDFSVSRKLRGEQAFMQLIGGSVELPPTPNMPAPNKVRDQALRDMYLDPQPHMDGARIKASADGKFALEFLVGGHPRGAENKDGLAFVPIRRGEIYAVRLYNDSDYEAAAQLTIDGLNFFAFSELRDHEGRPRYSVVFVPPRSSVVIPGWHRTNEVTDSFQVTSYAKSAAATIHHAQNIGVVTATFATAWTDVPPPDETPQTKSLGGDATGFGPRISQQYAEVKRNIGSVRASVSARYTK